MTRLGVISDTHLRSPDATLERIVKAYFADVDLIVHLGDYVDPSIVRYLIRQKEFIGVAGNMDPPELKNGFPSKRLLELENRRIGMIHGWGAPFGLEGRIHKEFVDIDAVLYGHTHKAANHRRGSVLFFNPGSATRPFMGRPSVGIVSVNDGIDGQILPL